MSRRGSGEEGMALLVVMVLMGVMLTVGFAIASTVDTQAGESRKQRVRDSSFNLAESALNAQIFALARDWPGLGAAKVPPTILPYPACTQASATPRCPDNAALVAGGSPDLAGATWQTSVRDNGAVSAPDFYSDASSALQPGYDANNDGRVWVRARAVVQGRPRTLVGLVRAEKQEEDLPHAALLAGSLDITNNGKKELIRSAGAPVRVRCNPISVGFLGKSCVGQAVSSALDLTNLLTGRLATQISGTSPVSVPTAPAAMAPEARARLKATAIANGTYYAACPTAAQLTGQIVYVATGNCSYTSNTQFNSAQAPGVLIMESGTLAFGGTSNFFGVVYHANLLNVSTTAVETQGNARIRGGVLIDGMAQFEVGSSGLNIDFDLNAYRAVSSYGSAGVIQNTFREIQAG